MPGYVLILIWLWELLYIDFLLIVVQLAFLHSVGLHGRCLGKLITLFQPWSVQIEERATELFESIIRSDNIPINMDVPTKPQTLLEYMEGWRMKLWDQAYTGVFKGADAYKKSDSFKDFRGSEHAVKRVIFR